MKTTLKIMAFALLTAMVLTGCQKEYTITVVSNNPEWGTVSGGGLYPDGADATISATPFEGYYFVSWQDGDRNNPRVVRVTQNVTYTAVFSNTPGGGGGDDGDPLTMSGTISENVTWPDRGLPVDYIVDGMLNIEGNALLTVDPGVTIMFTSVYGGLNVSENAGLRMVGTAEKPIVLQGPANNPNNGSWDGVAVTSRRSDNQFEYVQFLRGGSNDIAYAGVVDVTGKLSMKHCLVDGGLSNGVSLESEGYLTAFENNEVRNCSYYPVRVENFESACKGFNATNTFSGNTAGNVIYLANIGANIETENLTFAYTGYPYRAEGSIGIDGNKTFTIEPGVVIEMNSNESFTVSGVTFVANGTGDRPIVFRCVQEGEQWNGVGIFSSRNGNSISHCQIRDCGTGDWYAENHCLYIGGNARLALTNNVFGPSAWYGVAIESIESWGNVTHSGNTFVSCDNGNVWIEGGGEYNGQEYEDGQILTDLP